MAPWRCAHCPASFRRASELGNHLRTHPEARSAARVRTHEPFHGTVVFENTEYPAASVEDEHYGAAAGLPTAGQQLCSPAELSRARLMELYANGNGGSGLSDSDMSTVLSILHEALAAGLDVSDLFRSSDALVTELARLSKESPELLWYVTEVKSPSFPQTPSVKLLYRKMEDVVKHFVATNDIVWGAWKPHVCLC